MNHIVFRCLSAICLLTASIASADYCTNNANCTPCYDKGDLNFYIGANIGVGSHTAYRNDLDGFLTDNSGWSSIGTGFVGGGQIGVDWQRCNLLIGLIGDFNGAAPSSQIDDEPNDSIDLNYVNNKLDWIATIRARAGLTVNDVLIYITAGAAKAKFPVTWREDDVFFRHSSSPWGWTGGAGTEFYLCKNLSLGAELLFAHFSHRTRTFEEAGNFFAFGHSDSVWTGKIMINYNFGGGFFSCCK